MDPIEQLLENNRNWARDQLKSDPEFFNKLAGLQTPEFLWIGCSDSRVPANQITGMPPGSIFVHRNIANLVVHTDINLATVLEYALKVLRIRHVIVCGHYGCGGIQAAMTRKDFGIINKWLLHIKDVIRFHRKELDEISDDTQRANRLTELNVETQVQNLAGMTVVQECWKQDERPHLHGWVYDLKDGILRPIIHIKPGELSDPLYQYDL